VANQKRGKLAGQELRSDGAISTYQYVRALNKAYEGTVTAGNSPVTIDFRGDQGWNSIQGWVTCDGQIQPDGSTIGDIQLEFSRDGTVYGDKWTLRPGENTSVQGFDIAVIRIYHTGDDSDYRVFLI